MISQHLSYTTHFPDLTHEHIMLTLIESTHLIQMPLIIALFHKKLQHPLIQSGYGTGKYIIDPSVGLQKALRQHQITDTDGRRNGFGKGSKIDYTAAPVISLQGRNGFSNITELTVVIIFNQISARLLFCPAQQLLPSLDRHDNSQRILMRRHHIGNVRTTLFQLFHIHAKLIHRYRPTIITKLLEHIPCMSISRTLHGNLMIHPKNPGQQHEQIVISSSHDHLLRLHMHSTGLMKVGTDHLSELPFSAGFPQQKEITLILLQHFPVQLPPGCKRKMLQINSIWRKIIAICIGFRLYYPLRLHRCCIQSIQCFHLTHKITLTWNGFNIPFRQQLLIGKLGSTSAHVQVRRQQTGRRQTLPAL